MAVEVEAVRPSDDVNWPLVHYVAGVAKGIEEMYGFGFMHIGTSTSHEEFMFFCQVGVDMHFRAFAIEKNAELDEGRKDEITQSVLDAQQALTDYAAEQTRSIWTPGGLNGAVEV